MVSVPTASVVPEASSVVPEAAAPSVVAAAGVPSVVAAGVPSVVAAGVPSVVAAGVPSVVVGAGAAGSGLGSSFGVYCKSKAGNITHLYKNPQHLLR